MEELAQRTRRLARDLCPGEPLGKKGCAASNLCAFAVTWYRPNSSKCTGPSLSAHIQ